MALFASKELKDKLEQASSRIETLETQLEQANTRAEALEQENTNLKTAVAASASVIKDQEKEHAAALDDKEKEVDTKAAAKAAETLASVGHNAVDAAGAEASAGTTGIAEQYLKLTGTSRREFYNTHKSELMAALSAAAK